MQDEVTPYNMSEAETMRQSMRLITVLVVFPIILGLVISPTALQTNHIPEVANSAFGGRNESFSLSQGTLEGTLNPNTITQRGHQVSDLVRARTDSGKNAQQDITIDEGDGWTVSEARVEVTNLRKLYAVNGTFDDEVDPWTSSTYDPSGGSQTQSAVWNSTEGYVTCVNYGELTTHPVQDDTYTHHLDTEILWEQTVINSPQTDNFSLSFDYRYVSGPIDLEPYDFNGDVELRIYVHTDIYYLSIATSGTRNVWYSISDYPIELTGAPASFDVGVGIYVEYQDLVLTENGDYDDDGSPDGLVNAEKIEVHLDEFEFTSQTPVPFAGVDLTFDVEGSTESILGATGGIGTATVSNPSLWSVDPLTIEVTANSSVSFDYQLTTYFQRDVNSSWTTDLYEHGVSYSINPGLSADLELYTYITMSTEYDNITLDIRFPSDWENTTITDALQSDVTGLCTISAGYIHVPNSLFDRAGWWKITHQSFNYAKDMAVQIQDGGWIDNSLFRTGNMTRTEVEIGTASVTPTSGTPVDIDWILPNGTIWFSESITTMVSGVVTSSSLVFGGENTTAGQWTVEVFWNNGTEIAYSTITFDLYHTVSISVSYPLIETDHGLVISNQITLIDIDSGEYLMDDSVSLSANWSSTTVTFTQNYAKNWWHADFDTSLIPNGEFTVIVDASRPYFDPVSTQFTVVASLETSLEITNAGAIPIDRGLNEIFTVQFDYEMVNGTGIEGATVSISYTGSGGGLSSDSFTDIGSGQYSLNIVGGISDTYEVTITMSKAYHYNASDSFVLIIGETGTDLTVLNGTADVITYGDSYRLVLEYQNSTGHGLSGATLEIVSITPGTGLTNGSFISVTPGYYEVILKPNIIDTFSIVIEASLFNHETQYVSFTLTGVFIPTNMDILNADAVVENGLNEIFTVQMSYEFLNGTGISGASPTVIFTGPQEGLSWTNFIDNNNGLYQLDIKCNVSAIYGITITMSKAYHYNTSDSFTLIIGETGSELQLLNGTADVVLFGDSYLLVVEYRNSTGSGLAGANLQVVTITPETGLVHTNFSHIIDGFYQINMTPTAAGSFSVVISASIINHETQYATFTLTATGIPTILTTTPSSASIAVDQNFTVQLSLKVDPTLFPIDGANFTVTNPPSGVIISDVIPIGGGFYNFTLTPLETGTFNILFRSSADNYQSSSAAFTLIVTEIPTIIVFAGGVSSALVEYGELYQLTIYYYRADTFVNVDGANVTVSVQDPGLVISVIPGSGFYIVNIRGQATGTWSLTVTGNKTDHYLATKQFLFEVEEIDTDLEGSSPLEALYVGRSYQFTFSYLFDSNSSTILGATIVSSGEGADWVTYSELGNGQYAVNLTPLELGNHYVILTFEKTGFESASFRLTFNVGRIPITVTILEGANGLEGTTNILRVSITETDTGNPVSGATVFYRIKTVSTGFETDPVPMPESSVPGIYTASLLLPDADEVYDVLVSCEAENYELGAPLSMQLGISRSFTSVLMVYSIRYWWAIFGIVAIVGAMSYRRAARKRRVKQNKITLAIKRRFDDVRSLLGVIVLHKDSGLPIYSKILREGLEETVISAFITAITSFRGEFDIESSSEEWGLIPISDIVRVISTNKLVCAFITTGNPSAEQRERMIRFAKTVAFIFDDTIEEVPIVVLDHHTTMQFDALFEDILDGALLRTYKLDEGKKLPTSTCADERIARKTGEEFKLEELAEEISACGLEEGRVYQAIMRALEGAFLVTTDDSPFATELIRAPEAIDEEEE